MTIDGPPAHLADNVTIGELVRWADRQVVKLVKEGKADQAKSMAESSQVIEVSYWMYWQAVQDEASSNQYTTDLVDCRHESRV